MTNSNDLRFMAVTANLMVLARAYRGAADKALADYGLSQATAGRVVITERLGNGVRQGALAEALAEALGVEGPSLVRVLDPLVAANLMERREDTYDRRAKTLHLADAGNVLREQVEGVLARLRRTLFKDVNDGDQDVCLRVLDTLKGALGRASAVDIVD